jgi:hypothetical protein
MSEHSASRRAVVAGIAAFGAGLVLPIGPSIEAATRKHRRIDVHHHFVPDEIAGSNHIEPLLRGWSLPNRSMTWSRVV